MSYPVPDGNQPSTGDVESRLTDFHYAIFERLPDEGRTLGLRPLVVTVPHLRDRLNDSLEPGVPPFTSPVVQTEMRTLGKFGFVVRQVTLSGSTLGWQKTRRASELLAEYKLRTAEIVRSQTETEPEPEPEAEDPDVQPPRPDMRLGLADHQMFGGGN